MAKRTSDDGEDKSAALVALGEQIRRVRQERNISQEDFAARAGIARSYYGGIERGERNVAALNLMRIALTLGVEVGELFPSQQTLKNITPDTQKD
jgi:transcriptional regulator with XRE-family HTH domain